MLASTAERRGASLQVVKRLLEIANAHSTGIEH
jgi:hypothetical protein